MTRKNGDPDLPDARIRLDRLPADGRSLEVAATPDERAAIAELMSVTVVNRFGAIVRAAQLRGGVRITGTLEAEIVQPCVVTLEPVTQTISEPLDRIFLPLGARATPAPGSDVYVDIDAEDEPDAIDGPEVNLTPFLLETLALAIDPYPHAQGAGLPRESQDAEAPDSPFAKLQALKEKGE